MTRVNKWCLAPFIQDGAAIVVFAVLGMLSHDGSVFLAGFARDAVPLLVGRFGVAYGGRDVPPPPAAGSC